MARKLSQQWMSRLRSDTYIKPGSESSFDSFDCSRRYPEQQEHYCCNALTIRRAAALSGAATISMSMINFCIIMTGCGIELADMVLAVLPVVAACLALCFLLIAVRLHSPVSLKPFIAYHAISLGVMMCLCVCYIAYVLRFEFIANVLFSFERISSVARGLLLNGPGARTLLGLHLASNCVLHTLCLHSAVSYYFSLDSFIRYQSADCTEIL